MTRSGRLSTYLHNFAAGGLFAQQGHHLPTLLPQVEDVTDVEESSYVEKHIVW
jgi:hypothetical protein